MSNGGIFVSYCGLVLLTNERVGGCILREVTTVVSRYISRASLVTIGCPFLVDLFHT